MELVVGNCECIESEYTNSLFEQPWWLDLVAKGKWKEIYVKESDGTVLARFAYVIKGKKVILPELTQNIGIWMSDELKNDYGFQKKVINEVFNQMTNIKYFDFALSVNNKYVLPFRWLGGLIEPRFTYRINDLSDLDSLYNRFNKTAKKNIRYAKNKVVLNYNYNENNLWTLYEKTYMKQNRRVPISKEYMLNIAKTTVENGHGRYVEAVDTDGNIHSCALFIYDKNVCYYLLGATDSAYSKSGAQSLILWDGIQFAAKHSKCFDFEGSMVEGIENFFRQFGGECMPYYAVIKEPFFQQIARIMKPKIKKIIGYKI